MSRLFKNLPDDTQLLIREYASDRVGIRPCAAIIKTLEFIEIVDDPLRDPCTIVIADITDYFIPRRNRQTNILRFIIWHGRLYGKYQQWHRYHKHRPPYSSPPTPGLLDQ